MVENSICVAVIKHAHGVRGEVKLKSLSDNPDRFFSGEIYYLKTPSIKAKAGMSQKIPLQSLTLESLRPAAGGVDLIAKFQECENRDDAEKLSGFELHVISANVDEGGTEDNYYHYQLIGLPVFRNGLALGEIQGVLNFGASDLLEIKSKQGKTLLIPFLKQYVPVVNLEARRIELDIPDEFLE